MRKFLGISLFLHGSVVIHTVLILQLDAARGLRFIGLLDSSQDDGLHQVKIILSTRCIELQNLHLNKAKYPTPPADMQQQLTGSDETLDPTRELALV